MESRAQNHHPQNAVVGALSLLLAACGAEELPEQLPQVALSGHFESVPIPVMVDVDITNAGPTYIRPFPATANEPEGFFVTSRTSFTCRLVDRQVECDPGTWLTLLLDDLDGDGNRDVVAPDATGLTITWGPLEQPSMPTQLPLSGNPVYAVRRGDELLVGSAGGTDLCSQNAPSLALFRRDGRSFTPVPFEQPRTLRVYTNMAWGELLGREMIVASASGCTDDSSSPILFGRTAEGGFAPVYVEGTPFAKGKPIPGVPMGIALGDYDSDGRPDLFITNDPEYQIYLATADGRLRPSPHPEDIYAPQTGHHDQLLGWGVVTLDLNGDGHDDFCVANGFDLARRTHQYGNDGPEWPSCFVQVEAGGEWGRFVDVTEQVGLDAFQGQWYGLEQADLDHDGHPDLLVGGQGRQPMVLLWVPDR
jgi:hypothetical protein